MPVRPFWLTGLMKCTKWFWPVIMLNGAVITGSGVDGMLRCRMFSLFLRWMQTNLARMLTCHKAVKLSGGAIQENWRLELQITGGRYEANSSGVAYRRPVCCCCFQRPCSNSPCCRRFTVRMCRSRSRFVCVQTALFWAGRFPDDSCIWPGPGPQAVRDPKLKTTGPGLVAQLGEIMARIHKITPQDEHAQRYQRLACPDIKTARRSFRLRRCALLTSWVLPIRYWNTG